jgi:cytochrome c oxidase subunit IV
MAHHQHQAGVIPPPQTKWIWKVFWILLIVTIVEVVIALPNIRSAFPAPWLFKLALIGGTLFKAAYIVGAYMHLKDEVKNLILSVVLPFILIIYLIVLMLIEGSYVTLYRTVVEQILVQ